MREFTETTVFLERVLGTAETGTSEVSCYGYKPIVFVSPVHESDGSDPRSGLVVLARTRSFWLRQRISPSPMAHTRGRD